MPVYPIPDDWDGETWGCVLIDWPLSEQWFGILRGLITTPVRGRFWDGSTGIITDAQAIGLDIEGRNPVVSCSDITDALLLLNATLENLDVSNNQQVTVLTDLDVSVQSIATSVSQATIDQTVALVAVQIAAAQAEANAFAWSQAFAQNLTPVTIINNTEIQFRPIEVGVDPPPQTSEATPTAITSTLEDTDYDLICRRVYWLLRNAKEFFNYFDGVQEDIAGTVLGLMGAASSALWVASMKAVPDSKRFLIPAAVIISFAHSLQELWGEVPNPVRQLSDWLDADYQELTCQISVAVEAAAKTEVLQSMIKASAISSGVSNSVAGLAMMIFNFSSLAALFYVSPLLDTAPPIPAYEPANICSACGG